MMNTNPHAFGVDDIAPPQRHTGVQIVFFGWVNSSKHYWVTFGERRSPSIVWKTP